MYNQINDFPSGNALFLKQKHGFRNQERDIWKTEFLFMVLKRKVFFYIWQHEWSLLSDALRFKTKNVVSASEM